MGIAAVEFGHGVVSKFDAAGTMAGAGEFWEEENGHSQEHRQECADAFRDTPLCGLV